MTTVVTRDPGATRAVGAAVGRLLRAGDVVVLSGTLGSGKTAFAQGVAAGLGVTEPVTSPTFAIVQEYAGRLPVAHVDVYRLDRVQELHDLGFDELVGGGGVTIVEWGDAIAPVLPPDRLEVRLATIADGDDDERSITLNAHGASWNGRSGALDHDVRAAAGEDAHDAGAADGLGR